MAVHPLRRRDAVLPLLVLGLTFLIANHFGHEEFGWLFGMSMAMISAVVIVYREGLRHSAFLAAICLFIGIHALAFYLVCSRYNDLPVKTLFPAFVFDFIAMAWLIPKIARLTFETE